jgi:hypothetical protein
MVSKDDHGGPVSQPLEPPTKTINELGCDALGFRMDDISPYNDHIRLKLVQLLEEVLKNFGVLIMTLQATPVDISNMCDLDQRMLPLLIILERLIIP